MNPIRLLSHWTTRSALGTTSALRVEVTPPSLRHAPSSAWQRLLFWLLAPAPHESAPPLTRLPAVQGDFRACLTDLEHGDAVGLRRRIDGACTLRELWHLRPEVYRLVALQHSQWEAERRVASLNRHFPTRAPRSGFAPLSD